MFLLSHPAPYQAIEALVSAGWNIERAADEVVPLLCFLDKSFDEDDFFTNHTGSYDEAPDKASALPGALQASMGTETPEQGLGEQNSDKKASQVAKSLTQQASKAKKPVPQGGSGRNKSSTMIGKTTKQHVTPTKPTQKRSILRLLPSIQQKTLKAKKKPSDKGTVVKKPQPPPPKPQEKPDGLGRTLSRISSRRQKVEALEAARKKADALERETARLEAEGNAAAEEYCLKLEEGAHLRIDLMGSPSQEKPLVKGAKPSLFSKMIQSAPLLEEDMRRQALSEREVLKAQRDHDEAERLERQRRFDQEARDRAQATRLQREREREEAEAQRRAEEAEAQRRAEEACRQEEAAAKLLAQEEARRAVEAEVRRTAQRDSASTLIQALVRGGVARRYTEQRQEREAILAAERIQGGCTGHLARGWVKREQGRIEQEASMRIQSAVLGSAVRRKTAEKRRIEEKVSSYPIRALMRGHMARRDVSRRCREREAASQRLQSLILGKLARTNVIREKKQEAARQQAELEMLEKERVERLRLECIAREKQEKDRIAKEALEKAERDRVQKERQMEKERRDREKQEMNRREREKQEKINAAKSQKKGEAERRQREEQIKQEDSKQNIENKAENKPSGVVSKVAEARRKAAEALAKEERQKAEAAALLRGQEVARVTAMAQTAERLNHAMSASRVDLERTRRASTGSINAPLGYPVKRTSSTSELRQTSTEFTRVLPKRGFSQPKQEPQEQKVIPVEKVKSRERPRDVKDKMPCLPQRASSRGSTSSRGGSAKGVRRGLRETPNQATETVEQAVCATDVKTSKLSANQLLMRSLGTQVKKRGVGARR